MNGANGADGGNVIEANQCGELSLAVEELLHDGITQLRRTDVTIELDGELRPDFDSQFIAYFDDAFPAMGNALHAVRRIRAAS